MCRYVLNDSCMHSEPGGSCVVYHCEMISAFLLAVQETIIMWYYIYPVLFSMLCIVICSGALHRLSKMNYNYVRSSNATTIIANASTIAVLITIICLLLLLLLLSDAFLLLLILLLILLHCSQVSSTRHIESQILKCLGLRIR